MRDPVELAAIAIPVLIELVAVALLCAAGAVWMIILSTPAVPA